MEEFIKLFNQKAVYSRFSDSLITFNTIEEIEEIIKSNIGTGVYSDGAILYDMFAKLEDNFIDSSYVITIDGETISLYDFMKDNGGFDNDGTFLTVFSEKVADREEDPIKFMYCKKSDNEEAIIYNSEDNLRMTVGHLISMLSPYADKEFTFCGEDSLGIYIKDNSLMLDTPQFIEELLEE